MWTSFSLSRHWKHHYLHFDLIAILLEDEIVVRSAAVFTRLRGTARRWILSRRGFESCSSSVVVKVFVRSDHVRNVKVLCEESFQVIRVLLIKARTFFRRLDRMMHEEKNMRLVLISLKVSRQ